MKYIFSLFIALWSIAAWGQEGGDGFNPSNPGEPGQRYNLTVNVTPDGAGSTSPSGKQQYALGESVYLSANANNYYQFVGWAQDGDTISRSRSFNYTMPAKNTTITAVFKATDSFNPDDPDDPSQEVIKYKLNLTASPIEGGRFNITSGERFSEGTNISIHAYPSSNYQFEGWKQGNTILSTEGIYSFVMGKEDVSITGLFRFNPDSPGNPGANHWNAETGELIIDDFTPGSIMNAVSNVIGGSGNYDKVTMVTVSGRMGSGDFGIVDNLKNCTLIDLSRTGGYTAIPSYAFDGTNLSTAILPACVEEIGYYAFGNCKNLTDIICYAITPPAVGGSNAFEGIADGAVVRVLSSSIPLYAEAAVWQDFTILPLTEDVKALEVNLPTGSEGIYKNMTLELQNLQNGQKQRYVVSDRITYTFNGLLKNCSYSVSLKTPTGVVLGQIEKIEIKEENQTVTFSSLLTLLDVNLKVQTPDGKDVTSQIQVTWLDANEAYLSQGSSLKAQTAGTKLNYRMVLNQDLGMQYVAPENQTYSVQEEDNQLVYTLTPIEMVTVSGLVKAANSGTLPGATVSISQKLNGKYSKSFIAQADNQGKFKLQVYNAESTISISAADYVSQTLVKGDFSESSDLGVFTLKSITGATISLSFTYTPSVAENEEANIQNWYSDYADVSYEIYNITQNKLITQYSIQYPSIILLEEVSEGDQLRITASGKSNTFLPVKSETTIDANNKANITFNIISLGGIKATYISTDNASIVGILYNSKGELLKKYSYSNASLSIANLTDGTYTLVSMTNSTLFNSILKLSELSNSGLTEGTDYVLNKIVVKSGAIAQVTNKSIPVLNESKLYYTGENTAFTVNKTSIVAGNYLTLKGKIDFKKEYADAVNNIQMIIDLPESCSFVENSVLVGSQISSYILDANRLIIPLNNDTDQVRFCVIPAAGGSYTPNAFVEFSLGDKTIQQPIGSAYYEVKDLTISVPKTVAKANIPVSGTAQGYSIVEIYDNNVLIGSTTALANGIWTTTCDLYQPYNLSTHRINAKVTTKEGLELRSETQEAVYDISTIEVTKVTMINVAHPASSLDLCEYVTVFDFQNPKAQIPAYWYWPSYPDFTFKVEFTNGSPEMVSDVCLYVKTSAETIVKLPATYDKKKDIWIASAKFGSEALPINLSVDYHANTQALIDKQGYKDYNNELESFTEWFNELGNDIEKANQEEIVDILKDLGCTYDDLYDAELQKKLQGMSEADMCTYAESLIDSYTSENEIVNSVLTETLKYNIYSSTTLDNGIKLECTTTENLSVEELIAHGFEVHQTTDSDSIFTLFKDNTIEIVSFTENCHYKVYSPNSNNLLFSAQSFASGKENNFLSTLNSCCETVENAISEIDEWYKGVSAPFNDLIQLFEKETKNFEAVLKVQKNTLSNCKSEQKIAEWTLKVTETEKQIARHKKIIGGLGKCMTFVKKAIPIVNLISYGRTTLVQLQKLYNIAIKIYPCPEDQVNADNCAGRVIALMITASTYYANKIAFEVLTDGAAVAQAAATVPTGGLSAVTAFLTYMGKRAIEIGVDFLYEKATEKATEVLNRDVNQLECNKKCDTPPCNNNDGGDSQDSSSSGNGGGKSGNSGSGDVPHVMDPSGYVYEAVGSNRLKGVTATCYYKEMVEDMYGDLHENVVLWDATEYAQENPLFTDESGMYAWDVPQGLWQVKFEKEGYQTTYSEWLPVPPPQLEVNIGMVQTAQPTVTAVRGYETGIEIDFSKFMLPETMTAEFITITRNGEAVAGEVTFKNAEANPQNKNEQFVSKVRFVPSEALATTDKVILTVSKRVKSYAGIQMESDYSQEIAIEKEPKAVVASEIEVVYNETAEITVTVEPAEASTGKKVTATSVSSTIAAIEPAEATLDEEGKATFTISGELPGQTMIQFAVEGMDMKPEVKVSVVEAGEKNITQNYTLAMGWNWFSINVQDQNLNDIPALLAPIKESVLILKGQNGELTNKNESDWEGSLNSLSTTQTYKIKMKKEATLELSGKGSDPTSNTITLNQGWNWIGYVPTVTLPLEQALQNLQAEENDLIKGLDSFAIYDGSTWTGSLTHLLPGEGYMYYSQSVKSFNYAANGTESEPSSTPSPQWDYDVHQSEDNMIAIAELYSGEQKAETGKFLVGVFVDGECRGIAVEKDGYLFITAHGEQTDGKLTLRAFDTADQLEYNVKEEIEWSGTLTGSLTTPVSLHIGEATGITPISEGLLVYPSPVRHRLYIRGDIGNIEEVRISDTAGQTLIVDKQVIPGEGINVSSLSKGIYFIIIKTDNEVIQQKFMKID